MIVGTTIMPLTWSVGAGWPSSSSQEVSGARGLRGAGSGTEPWEGHHKQVGIEKTTVQHVGGRYDAVSSLVRRAI